MRASPRGLTAYPVDSINPIENRDGKRLKPGNSIRAEWPGLASGNDFGSQRCFPNEALPSLQFGFSGLQRVSGFGVFGF